MVPSYFKVGKTGSQLFQACQTLLQLFGVLKVDPYYLEIKKCRSQLLGARKKIMTSIQSLKNWFTAISSTKKCFPAIWKWKKLVPNYFKPDKHCCSNYEKERSRSLLFGD